jgi:hypothetical protein
MSRPLIYSLLLLLTPSHALPSSAFTTRLEDPKAVSVRQCVSPAIPLLQFVLLYESSPSRLGSSCIHTFMGRAGAISGTLLTLAIALTIPL